MLGLTKPLKELDLEKRIVEKIPHDGFNVGYVGTVDFGKLNNDFINLCSQVNIPEVNFIVASGDSQQHLRDEAVNTGILEKFAFLGQVDRSHIPDILSKIDVFGYPLQPLHFGTCEQVLGEATNMDGIKQLFDSNPMFYSKNKGSVLQYLQFFPEDKTLQAWAGILHMAKITNEAAFKSATTPSSRN